MFRIMTLAAAALVLAGPALRAEDPLAAQIQQHAPAVIEALKSKGFTNVGVLKFLVQRHDSEPARDDVGDLNLSLANKMEVALILANTDEKFGIIDKASEFVAREKMTSANHRSEEGRRGFFTRKYDLAWSKDKVEPSGFVTGIVSLSDGLKMMNLTLQAFDKTGTPFDLPVSIKVPVEPEMLAQAGFSFSVSTTQQKALIAGDAPPTAEARRADAASSALRAESAQRSKSALPPPGKPKPVEEAFAPLLESPVKLTVLYNGKPVKVSGNLIPEPGPNDRIEFLLKNPGPGTYAAVMLVNGENTLFQEKAAPLNCRKWVLAPGQEVAIRGFQLSQDTTAPFRVLAPEDMGPNAISYGPHAGTFRLVVYHGSMKEGAGSDTAPKAPSDEGMLAIANTRGGTRPEGVKPQSLKSLQATLRGRAKEASGARGYVVKSGGAERFETTTVSFVPSTDTPVADVSLRYFAPK